MNKSSNRKMSVKSYKALKEMGYIIFQFKRIFIASYYPKGTFFKRILEELTSDLLSGIKNIGLGIGSLLIAPLKVIYAFIPKIFIGVEDEDIKYK